MITTAQISSIATGNLYDADGDKVGSVGRVYLDNRTGEPEWVTVKTGLFGSRSTFVPLAEATVEGDDLHVPYDKATIKDAPKIDEDDELSPAEEDELYTYYGIQGGYDEGPDGDPATAGTAAAGDQAPEASPDAGRTPDAGDAGAPAGESTDAALSSGTAKLRRYMGESAHPVTDDGGRHEA